MHIVLTNSKGYLDRSVHYPPLNEQVIVVCGFPGIGKSTFSKQSPIQTPEDKIAGRPPESCAWEVIDLESSDFDKAHFPGNYVDKMCLIFEITGWSGNHKVVLCSSHKVVRDAFREACIPFVMIYPDKSLKEEYIARYKSRENHPMPLEVVEKFWDTWIDEMEAEKGDRIVLQSGQFLGDVFEIGEGYHVTTP